MRAVHFVGFRGDEYYRACRVFGVPDFVHIGWDRRTRREVAADDLIVFATGEYNQPYSARNYDDIKESA